VDINLNENNSMDQSPQKNPGTSLSAAALVIAILALLGSPVIFFVATGLATMSDGRTGALGIAVAWMFLCSLSVLLGILGRKRSKDSGHKAGLGLAAMIIGLLAEFTTIFTIYAIFQVEGLV
jgi:hypothetical protein